MLPDVMMLLPRFPAFAFMIFTLIYGILSGPALSDEMLDEKSFDKWLGELRVEATERGIRADIISDALDGVKLIPRVIELDRKQPEFTMTFDQYLGRVVSQARIKKGARLLRENRALLDEVSEKYGVQPQYIVALWGIETDFGRLTGGFSVVRALVTLSFDGRRSAYFRKELLNALQILNEGHIVNAKMTGSWAGAMGQSQFMPSSFLNFAVDYDGDGRRDIWTTRADVFASAANYLSRSGWQGDQTWGRQVRLPDGFDAALVGHKVKKTLSEWQDIGVRQTNSTDLPAYDMKASVILPDTGRGENPKASEKSNRAFLVYDNFRATLKWNRSDFFALAVGHLADAIVGR